MRSILVADPSEEVLQSIAQNLFSTRRFNIVQALNGSEVAQKSRNQEFDAFILSFDLKILSGKELVKTIKENHDNASTPIIFLTNDVEVSKVETEGYKNIYHLLRPYQMDDLFQLLEKAIIAGIQEKVDFNVDVEVVNPFINATMEILQEKCHFSNINYTKPKLLIHTKPFDLITSVLIKSAYYTGKVSACFEKQTFLKAASLYSGKDHKELTSDSKDLALEILQDIFDRANENIKKKKFHLEKAIPTLIEPQDFELKNNSSEQNIGIKFSCDQGDIIYVVNVVKQKVNK